ncbi:MAG: hypothetical protein HC819_11420 [Cyclobacteriaceae bacterium]|nr:hypothetical protein [Cyclobacteriaceae bacterium]
MSTIHEYISKNASLATIQRAKEILIRKMIISMKFFPQQKMIRAKVLGNWPYDVRINLSQKNGISSSCNCPYNYPGLCKHEVAVLLKYDEEGEKIWISSMKKNQMMKKKLNLLPT